jgi:5'-nucleotidase
MNNDGHNVEFAVHNAGGVRNSLPEGKITVDYAYIYNLRFEYDADAELGNRMSTLEIRRGELWEEVEDDKIYLGFSTAYTMKGKEGYDAVLKMEDKGYVSNHSMADCMITLIQENPEIFI